MEAPLVTVVCLCYNHERFVAEAIGSVINQTYNNLQIIVVDDASTDDSVANIKNIPPSARSIEYIFLKKNLGNCRAFNRALPQVKGEFIVDFSTDDVMMPDRIAKQIAFFHTLGDRYGVVFSDAVYIDETGSELRDHYDYLFKKGLIDRIPQGDIYRDLLSTYFIASPTMLSRMQVMRDLKGYDEQLSYEDFDFWIRSSRHYKYAYQEDKLTRIRKSRHSMSTRSYKPGDKQLYSTYLVCLKAQRLNQDEGDVRALAQRVKFELRQSVFSGNHEEAHLFFGLLSELGHVSFADKVMKLLNATKIPLAFLRRWYHSLRYD
jgi:glycosyltransferase involved in cell wall biosynthesis